jgi:hypothetical protein
LSLRKEIQIARKFLDKEFSFASDASKWANQNFNLSISPQTIRRSIKNQNLKSYKKQKKPDLTSKQVKARRRFAKLHKDWDFTDWNKIIFSDESKFNLHGADGNTRVWCLDGTQLQPENIQGTKKFGAGNIMVWGCITSKGVGKLVKV